METGIVKWFRIDKQNGNKSYGFFIRPDGSELFAHWNSRCGFSSTGTKPEFNAEFPTNIPGLGTQVIYKLGKGRKGLKAEAWGFESDYAKALAEIKKREETILALRGKLNQYAYEEQLRCNPLWRLIEQEHRFGKPTEKLSTILFAGTRSSLQDKLNPPTYASGRPLIVISGKVIDGYQYVRHFEREVSGGWERCEDPMKIELPSRSMVSLEMACAILSEASLYLRAQAYGSGHNYVWKRRGEIVASGSDSVVGFTIELHETGWHLATQFNGDAARLLASYAENTVRREYEHRR